MVNTLHLMKTNFFADYASLKDSFFVSPLFFSTEESIAVSLELNPYVSSTQKNEILDKILSNHNFKLNKINAVKLNKATGVGSVEMQITHLPTAFNFTTKIISKV